LVCASYRESSYPAPKKHHLIVSSSIIGYIISYFTYLPVIWHHNKTRKIDPDRLSPESRLWWLLFLVPLLPIGLMMVCTLSRILLDLSSTLHFGSA
jgi:hypothetical protein